MRVCAIDIGTNSVRSLIAEGEGSKLEVIADGLVTTRLGENLKMTGALERRAIERTAHAVADFVGKARALNVVQFRIVATSAARKAANHRELLKQIEELTGLPARIVTGREEAELIYRGVRASINNIAEEIVITDIGGGSTEVIAGGDDLSLFSVDIGAVSITEEFFAGDPPGSDEITGAADFIEAALSGTLQGVDLSQKKLIGAGGTVTTAAAIDLELVEYDKEKIHGALLGKGNVDVIFQKLSRLNCIERSRIQGLEPARADIIVAGILILKTLMELIPAETITVSDTGLLYGLALEGIKPFGQGSKIT